MLIINNIDIYLLEDIAEMCKEAEVNLIYLLFYSPDLSPIKEFFNGLKQ
jgi:transposase